jgi:hypothetical protein
VACFGLLPDKETDEGAREAGGVCVNRKCGRAATRTVDGVSVCSSCNVYNGKQDSGRAYTIVSRY